MYFSANQIASIIGGSVDGNGEVVVDRVSKIEDANAGSLTFLANPKYEQFLYTTGASVVIVNDSLKLNKDISSTLIRVDDAYTSFSLLLDLYNKMRLDKTGIDSQAAIHESTTLGSDIYIGAFAFIGENVKIGNGSKIYPHVYIGDNTEIGENCVVFPHVTIYFDCKLGNNVIIHSGSVVGSDGFGFAPQADGSYNKVSQIGNVIIEDDVEIGANTVVDRATMGSTVIRKGVKLDNLIQIAHNVEIGKNTVIAAQSGISGSTKIGQNVIVGGQVGIVGHINIADGSKIQAQSGINRSLPLADKKWSGTPATLYNAQLRSQVLYSKLPELEKRISELEQQLLTRGDIKS